jgi:hypothetical protein
LIRRSRDGGGSVKGGWNRWLKCGRSRVHGEVSSKGAPSCVRETEEVVGNKPSISRYTEGWRQQGPPSSRIRVMEGVGSEEWWATKTLRLASDEGVGNENPPSSRVRETVGWATRTLHLTLDGGMGNKNPPSRVRRRDASRVRWRGVGSEDPPTSRV